MAERGVILDRTTAERMARATKAYERQPVDMRGPRVPFRQRIHPFVTFRVKLVQSGGANGSLVAHPTYTYHVYWPWDEDNEKKLNVASSGAAISPEKGRTIYGRVTAADKGLAYFDHTGTLQLYEADEPPFQAQGCVP
jgi:hypothetical protein